MAKLSASDRDKLPKEKFAEPEKRAYPDRERSACQERQGACEPGCESGQNVESRRGQDRQKGRRRHQEEVKDIPMVVRAGLVRRGSLRLVGKFDPYRRMIAGLLPASNLPIDLGSRQSLG
jgi:hypothetical protein